MYPCRVRWKRTSCQQLRVVVFALHLLGELELLQEEAFGSLVIMDWGWERADTAWGAKVSESQLIVIPSFGLSRMVIVDIYCGLNHNAWIHICQDRRIYHGKLFPSSIVISLVIDYHKTVRCVCPRTNTELAYFLSHYFATVFRNHTWGIHRRKGWYTISAWQPPLYRIT